MSRKLTDLFSDNAFDTYLINCPRCGSNSCEFRNNEFYCPLCFYTEVTPAELENLGESIESVAENSHAFYNSDTYERKTYLNIKTMFDVIALEDGKNGKSYWNKIGVAYPLQNGARGFNLKLHFVPGARYIIKESLRNPPEPETADSDPDTPF